MAKQITVKSINADFTACLDPVSKWDESYAASMAATQICPLRSANCWLLLALDAEKQADEYSDIWAFRHAANYHQNAAEYRMRAEAAYARYAAIDRMLSEYAEQQAAIAQEDQENERRRKMLCPYCFSPYLPCDCGTDN